MIRHYAIGQQPNRHRSQRRRHDPFKGGVIGIVSKQVAPVVSAVETMKNDVPRRNSRFPWHVIRVTRCICCVKLTGFLPFSGPRPEHQRYAPYPAGPP